MTFNEYHFKSYLNEALKAINFVNPTKVQEIVLPQALDKKSLMVESATGSGKTHAFLLPILEHLDENLNKVQALIIAPTRELASQLYNECLKLVKHSKIKIDVAKVIGGVDRDAELKRYAKCQPQIVIGTIGRLQDLVNDTNILKIYEASTVVIDEADMIFEEKELLEVDKIIGKIQNKPQFLIFSATIPQGLQHFLHKYLTDVETISLKEENLTKDNIVHLMLQCKAKNKEEVLIELLKIINPFLAIIFVNTKENVENVALMLAKNGYKVAKLHGALEDRIRKQTLKRIAALEYKYVVASDIAARGIDIRGVSHVINYDLPNNIEFYIHRTGRTARYNQTGYAYSLYTYDDDNYVKQLQTKGLKPQFVKIEQNEIVATKFYIKKKTSFNQEIEQKIHQTTKMPKKVKPGYRKKRLEEINKKIKKAKREDISQIYRKKAQKQGENK